MYEPHRYKLKSEWNQMFKDDSSTKNNEEQKTLNQNSILWKSY